MNIRFCNLVLVTVTSAEALYAAQTLPPVRPLGPVLGTSTIPLESVSQVRSLPGGRVIVNDNTGRRVVIFDSTLKDATIIADSTSSTARMYGPTIGGLVAFRGDSTLFVNPTSLTMLVIDPNGKIVRTMAVPQPNEANYLIGGPFGTPGLDSRGRLVYRARVGGFTRIIPAPTSGQPPALQMPDSAMVVRFDLATRGADTVARFAVPMIMQSLTKDEGGQTRLMTTINPMPWTDDWALLSDGRVAIVHGREYRVDFVDASGKLTSAPKIPFEWQRLTDDDKAEIIDSARTAMEQLHAVQTPLSAAVATASASSASPLHFVTLNEIPDYRPVFRQAAAHGDAAGNLWIRTSKMVNGGAVYDVIDRNGVLIDRIQVLPGRVVAGFGPNGTVYMGVMDGTVARLERARVTIPSK